VAYPRRTTEFAEPSGLRHDKLMKRASLGRENHNWRQAQKIGKREDCEFKHRRDRTFMCVPAKSIWSLASENSGLMAKQEGRVREV
jgi:hypothetical protein